MYTLDDVKKALVAAVEKAARGKRNPKESATCLYTSPDNPDDHCIVGQVLVDLGLELPTYNGSFTAYCHSEGVGMSVNDLEYSIAEDYVDRGDMTADAALWLGEVQWYFDGGGEKPFASPPTWRQALATCRKKGLV